MKSFQWWQWCFIIIVFGIVYYSVYPKYSFPGDMSRVFTRCNQITGNIQFEYDGKWITAGKRPEITKTQ